MSLQQTVYASAARTATPTAVVVNARQYTTLRVILDATAVTSSPSVTVTVEVLDAASGKWCTVLTSSAIATVSTNVLTLVQGLAGQFRVTCTHGNANSITYTVGVHLSR
jgi:hypothetical protein